ncbi:hypothetical protein J2W25_004604 [Variovorax boronicumulans]|uniref:Uncharacterized protein n=1 Tax=Variovorax boronicumulans TaxID=436515 RepID=A0AAW8E2K1_9BURK|nr:hypothetical protein [Variovorax boronicumulans]MDP9880276.1 hypothetical protein [Variovorax boronicumulans]MDP9925561.1 hypothetical protein [Variovorax boronicumulans]
MIAKNPLLQPTEGEATKDRAAFQRLPLSLAHFAALARSDLSPFAQILQQPLPEGFARLRAPLPLGTRSSKDLLAELRATYPVAEVLESADNVDPDSQLEKLKTRKEKQLATYMGVLLRWVHETHSKQHWLWGSKVNAKAVEADLLAWLHERSVVSTDVPEPGTMRRPLGTALKAFDHEYRLKSTT